MDMTPAILIFTPIFLPVAVSLGIDPIHFGIIMVLNLCIGLCTPPVGTVLFAGLRCGRRARSRGSSGRCFRSTSRCWRRCCSS